MGTSATLMERSRPYRFLVELARGKVNQLRSQLFDWRNGGLVVPPELTQRIQEVSHAFGRTVTAEGEDVIDREADGALVQAYRAAAQLVETYTTQVFQIRHQRSPRLDTAACPVGWARSFLRVSPGRNWFGPATRSASPSPGTRWRPKKPRIAGRH